MLFGKHINKYYLKYFWYFFFGIAFLILVDYVQLLVPETIGNLSTAIEDGEIKSIKDPLLIKSLFTIFYPPVPVIIKILFECTFCRMND